ncbi:MAG: VOC family protein [Proteobacteria bacterium]|nr:VOC family protein [Pseudomonadota bacterium]
MTSPLKRVSAISLFVDDLAAAKAFYRSVFDAEPVFEDEVSAALEFDNLIVNLLCVGSAGEIIEPHAPGGRDAGSRFQFSVWVEDVDAVCTRLRERGVALLAGPKDRPWGMRTANFVDPAGHSWEVAQKTGTRATGAAISPSPRIPAPPS